MNSDSSDIEPDQKDRPLEYDNIWQCRYVVQDKGKWKCMAPGCIIYGKWRKGLNSNKVLHHYNGTPGQNVVVCTGDVADNVRKAMRDLLSQYLMKKQRNSQGKAQLAMEIDCIQEKTCAPPVISVEAPSPSSPGAITPSAGMAPIFGDRKRPPETKVIDLSAGTKVIDLSSGTKPSYVSVVSSSRKKVKNTKQLTLTGNPVDPKAPSK